MKLCFTMKLVVSIVSVRLTSATLYTQFTRASNSLPDNALAVSDALLMFPAIFLSSQTQKQNTQAALPESSPPPQNYPRPQNLQPHHHHPNNLSPTPPRTRLNNQRSPAPRLRRRRQIVSLRDQCRAKTALLYHCRSRRTDDDRAAAVVSCGCVRRGRDVLRCRLVGVAA